MPAFIYQYQPNELGTFYFLCDMIIWAFQRHGQPRYGPEVQGKPHVQDECLPGAVVSQSAKKKRDAPDWWVGSSYTTTNSPLPHGSPFCMSGCCITGCSGGCLAVGLRLVSPCEGCL